MLKSTVVLLVILGGLIGICSGYGSTMNLMTVSVAAIATTPCSHEHLPEKSISIHRPMVFSGVVNSFQKQRCNQHRKFSSIIRQPLPEVGYSPNILVGWCYVGVWSRDL